MKTEKVIALLDQYSTEKFGLYWRQYPDILLDIEIFYALLISDSIILTDEDFYINEILNGKWCDSFKDFLKSKKIEIVNDKFWLKSPSILLDLPALSYTDTGDLFIFDYALRNSIPMLLSNTNSKDIKKILEIANKYLGTPNLGIPIDDKLQHTKSIAKWLVDIEIPTIKLRRERAENGIQHSYNNLTRHYDPICYPRIFYILEQFKYRLSQAIPISPNELTDIFTDKKSKEISMVLRNMTNEISSESQLKVKIKKQYREIDKKIGNSDFVFAGINLALMAIPFASIGTVPFQFITNKFLKKQYNWLLFCVSAEKILNKK